MSAEELLDTRSPWLQVQIAFDTEERAQSVSTALLEAHLVACCQLLGPMRSRYWWQGKLEEASEWLVLVKTAASCFDRVVALVEDQHPYETPEVLALSIVAGSPGYLAWLAQTIDDAP